MCYTGQMTTAQLLLLLLGFQAYSGDTESPTEREARMTLIADAITDASEHATCTGAYVTDTECKVQWTAGVKELQALLTVIGYRETRFSQHVHEGKCKANTGECDGGKARSPWQLHMTGFTPRDTWQKINEATKESTDLAAWSAAQILSYSYQHCRSIEGAISLYATGSNCTWSGAKYRKAFYDELMAK